MSLLRPFVWLLARLMYRLRVYGREKVPASGGCLLVCNHVTYLDWLILWAASPRTPTFVLWGSYYSHPVLAFFLWFARNRTVRIDDRTRRLPRNGRHRAA